MQKYNPAKTPDSKEWIALDEDERIYFVERFHRKHEEYGESLSLHSVIYTIAETQFAEDLKPAVYAFRRLRKEGLSRHDTIHAIGSALTDHIWKLLRGEGDRSGDVNEEYYESLAMLTKASWYALYKDDA